MKMVILNDAGYTADGKWRLVLVEPTRDIAERIEAVLKAEAAPFDEYTALRLRRVCRLVGIESAVPDDDKILWDCAFSVLGLVVAKLEKMAYVPRIEGASIEARLSADAQVLLDAGYAMRAANIKEAIEEINRLRAPNPPPNWTITRVPDKEFQPRDLIHVAKIGPDGRAERAGDLSRLDDRSLFWHFLNDWLLATEDKRPADLTPLPIDSEGGHCD